MLKKITLLALATVFVGASAAPEYYGCVLPKEGKESSAFLFLFDEAQKGLLDGDSGVLAMWPYGKVPHKCGVASVFDLTKPNPQIPDQGTRGAFLQFTCQRVQASEEGINVSTITFTFDRTTNVLANAVYSDMILNAQVKDKYITTSVSEARRFLCEKLDPRMFQKPPAGESEEP